SHRDAPLTETIVVDGPDILLCDRRPEAGPAGARIKLRIRAIQGIPAADAAIDTAIVNVVFPAERPLRSRSTCNLKLQRVQLLLPLLIGFVFFLPFRGARLLAGVIELMDADAVRFEFLVFLAPSLRVGTANVRANQPRRHRRARQGNGRPGEKFTPI